MFFSGLLLVIAIFYLFLKTRRRRPKHPMPPMYPGWLPLVGHAHKMIGNNNIRLMNFIENLSSFCVKCGGVIYVNIGLGTYYVVTDPEDAVTAANACMKKHFLYDQMEPWIGQGLLTSPNDTWKSHRKLMNPAFTLPVINNFLGLFNSQAKELVETIKPHDRKEPFNIITILERSSMETSFYSTYGKSLTRGEELQSFINKLTESLNLCLSKFQKIWLHSNFIYQLLGYKTREGYLIQYCKGVVTEVIRKAKEDRMNAKQFETPFNNCRSFLEVFLDLPNISNLSDEEFMDELNTVLVTSFDTSLASLSTALVIIGSYPEVQEEMYQEIIKVVGEAKDIEKEDMPKLVYTDAVIKEILRWMPTVPVVLRQIDDDVKLKNYTLRAGSSLILLIHGINRHGWEDAELFKPERWFNTPTNPNNFATFSVGKKNCIGRNYAMATLKVTIAHLVRAYKLTADVTKLVKAMNISVKPASGHEISIECRKKINVCKRR